MFKATFNNISVISWRSVLLVPEENHPPVACHWQTLSHIYLFGAHFISLVFLCKVFAFYLSA